MAGVVLAASVALLHRSASPGLAAASNHSRTDQDGDGLTDQQEIVLGTSPIRRDSDRDSYSDLEEVARGSEPLSEASLPDVPVGVGSCSSEENGYVKMLVSVFAGDSDMNNLWLGLGVVYQGQVIPLSYRDFQYATGFFQPARDAGERIAALEIGIPSRLVQRLGRLHVAAVLGSTDPAVERQVTIQSYTPVGGFVAAIELRRVGISSSGGAGTQGVVYRPLASDDQLTAAGWLSGKICFQRTAAVGTTGASILYEVDGADCIPMDTQCNPSECAAGVGTSLDLPDPAALIGG